MESSDLQVWNPPWFLVFLASRPKWLQSPYLESFYLIDSRRCWFSNHISIFWRSSPIQATWTVHKLKRKSPQRVGLFWIRNSKWLSICCFSKYFEPHKQTISSSGIRTYVLLGFLPLERWRYSGIWDLLTCIPIRYSRLHVFGSETHKERILPTTFRVLRKLKYFECTQS